MFIYYGILLIQMVIQSDAAAPLQIFLFLLGSYPTDIQFCILLAVSVCF